MQQQWRAEDTDLPASLHVGTSFDGAVFSAAFKGRTVGHTTLTIGFVQVHTRNIYAMQMYELVIMLVIRTTLTPSE